MRERAADDSIEENVETVCADLALFDQRNWIVLRLAVRVNSAEHGTWMNGQLEVTRQSRENRQHAHLNNHFSLWLF